MLISVFVEWVNRSRMDNFITRRALILYINHITSNKRCYKKKKDSKHLEQRSKKTIMTDAATQTDVELLQQSDIIEKTNRNDGDAVNDKQV